MSDQKKSKNKYIFVIIAIIAIAPPVVFARDSLGLDRVFTFGQSQNGVGDIDHQSSRNSSQKSFRSSSRSISSRSSSFFSSRSSRTSRSSISHSSKKSLSSSSSYSINNQSLTGTIQTSSGETLGVSAKLSIYGDSVSGSYSYSHIGESISLSGNLDGNKISMTERVNGEKTGKFDGTAVIKNNQLIRLSGDFTNTSTNQKSKFNWQNGSVSDSKNIVEARVNQPSCLIIREKNGNKIGDYKYKNKDDACLPDKVKVRVFLDRGETISDIQNIESSGTYTFVYIEELGGKNRSGWVAKEFLKF